MPELYQFRKDLLTLERPTPAIQVPDGNQVILKDGLVVTLVHALGGDFTVRTRVGAIFRVSGGDADALGKAIPEEYLQRGAVVDAARSEPTDEPRVWDMLRTCYDPEIPINIVELGLVYSCRVQKVEAGVEVDLQMTLTAPGCGMGEVLARDVRERVQTLPDVQQVRVEIVFEPAWDRSMMSESARLQMGMM